MSKSKLDRAKEAITSLGIEEQFLKSAGLSSLSELSPDNFSDPYPDGPTVVTKTALSGAPSKPKEQTKESLDAKERPGPTVASDVLIGFAGIDVTYAPRRNKSSYTPSCLMMDYIVHLMNYFLSDHTYFGRAAPDYHPYILRLYYGVIFWIQCLRAQHDVRAINGDRHQFLVRFLDAFPSESLPIAGPLIPLFKTLCSSQPEIPTYGKVFPSLPASAGPDRRSNFMVTDVANYFLPNVPGIFALLEDLDRLMSSPTPVYPKKNKHIPVTAVATQATVFGHHSFPVPNERTDAERWALCSPGLQYPCEADAKLNERFAERYSNFDFPPTAANDNLHEIEYFLSMDEDLSWFAQVRDIAAIAAQYFEGSGTLADCPPHGINANQFVVLLQAPSTLPTAPTKVADKASLVKPIFKLATTSRNPPALSSTLAAMAQTHVRMYSTHPRFSTFGDLANSGDFWAIRPIEFSAVDHSSYLSLNDSVRKMMKLKL